MRALQIIGKGLSAAALVVVAGLCIGGIVAGLVAIVLFMVAQECAGQLRSHC